MKKNNSNKKSDNYIALKDFCMQQGADVFGVADIESLRGTLNIADEIIGGLDTAVCIGVRLSSKILADIIEKPTKLYFHHYRTANMFLDQLAFTAANWIQRKGFQAVSIPASQILDWQQQTAHLSHKHIGHKAGIGWIGRNNLLVNPQLGAQFRLVTLLTDLPLKIDTPLDVDCEDCRRCIAVCPAGAIKEKKEEFDHQACFEMLKGFQKANIVGQYICGICVHACGLQKK